MMKRYAVLGMIIALVVSITAIGCSSSKSTTHQSTPTHTAAPTQIATPTATATPTTEPTETPGEVSELPANYKFFVTWSSDDNSGQMQYWIKGEKWNTAMNITSEGTETEMMMLYDGQFTYVYMPAADPTPAMVIKYLSSEAVINPGAAFSQQFQDDYYGDVSDATMLAGFEAACSGGASNDGPETVNGTPCTIFTCHSEDGVSRIWISDSGWPVKVETTIDGKTTTVEYSDIEFNADIADSMFDINAMAPGVPITDVP
jgi:outer membrane lipoprotein-sorting protein